MYHHLVLNNFAIASRVFDTSCVFTVEAILFFYQLLRQQLGNFLFLGDEVNKSVSVLSGGELAKLALAIVGISEIDLLVLDEPTNNLDIETVAQIIDSLEEYQGALLVISHDVDFLSRINITKSFKLKDKALLTTVYLPYETEQYYQELLY